MAQLGSVLGGILAELTAARVTADLYSKNLVEQYENDPLLATFSVPRVTVSDVNIVLRFVVTEVTEEEPEALGAKELQSEWPQHAQLSLLRRLSGFGLTEADKRKIVEEVRKKTGSFIGVPSIPEFETALKGSSGRVVSSTIQNILECWSILPPEWHRKLGSKEEFQSELESYISSAFSTFLEARIEQARIRAVLRSKINVAIQQPDLPQDPMQAQEIRLTLRSDDLGLILQSTQD